LFRFSFVMPRLGWINGLDLICPIQFPFHHSHQLKRYFRSQGVSLVIEWRPTWTISRAFFMSSQ
jgi:hypothetical protein